MLSIEIRFKNIVAFCSLLVFYRSNTFSIPLAFWYFLVLSSSRNVFSRAPSLLKSVFMHFGALFDLDMSFIEYFVHANLLLSTRNSSLNTAALSWPSMPFTEYVPLQ